MSSSGHLVLVEHLLGVSTEGDELLLFNLLIHVATVLAVILAYREDLGNLFLAAFNRPAPVKSPKFGLEMRDIWYTPAQARAIIGWVILSTLATGVLYLMAKDVIDPLATSVAVAGAGFLCTSVILALGQRLASGEANIRQVGTRRALGIGLAQFVAILPGVSRSGTTIAAGLGLGLGRLDAAKFSFFLAIPIILLGFALELLKNHDKLQWGDEGVPYVAGFLAALGVGMWAIQFLLKMLRGRDLYPFVYYTAALGIVTLVLHATGMI